MSFDPPHTASIAIRVIEGRLNADMFLVDKRMQMALKKKPESELYDLSLLYYEAYASWVLAKLCNRNVPENRILFLKYIAAFKDARERFLAEYARIK